jgi:hypothetical protein
MHQRDQYDDVDQFLFSSKQGSADNGVRQSVAAEYKGVNAGETQPGQCAAVRLTVPSGAPTRSGPFFVPIAQ